MSTPSIGVASLDFHAITSRLLTSPSRNTAFPLVRMRGAKSRSSHVAISGNAPLHKRTKAECFPSGVMSKSRKTPDGVTFAIARDATSMR